MIISIDTSDNQNIFVALKKGNEVIKRISCEARFSQAEKLLSQIQSLLLENNITQADIVKIMVANQGEGFTSLRIAVATANALGFAWGIPVVDQENSNIKKNGLKLVIPKYKKEPNINKKAKIK